MTVFKVLFLSAGIIGLNTAIPISPTIKSQSNIAKEQSISSMVNDPQSKKNNSCFIPRATTALGLLNTNNDSDVVANKIKIHIPEKLTLDHCPEFPLTKWQHYKHPVLTGFLHAYQACVVETNDPKYPYRMWFFGWISAICNPDYPGCDAIYHARSKNLKKWEVYCKDGSWDAGGNNSKWASILYSSTDQSNFYDAWHSGDPSVVLKDGIYYMAYSATSKPLPKPTKGYPSGMMLSVMGATSTDGIHWIKTKKPLLKAEMDTVFPPKADQGRIGDFHRPCLLWDGEENKWKLYFDYYNAGLPGNFQMGLAENKHDFVKGTFEFVHSLDKPLLLNWPNPEVVKIGTCYFSFSDAPGYSGAQVPKGKIKNLWMDRQIRMAQSSDGITWQKEYYIPSDPGIQASHIPQTLVCKRNGKWWLYLFYSTQVGWRKTGMNYPIFKEGQYNWFYDQIRYMRQQIK